jgi:hypothetical protein
VAGYEYHGDHQILEIECGEARLAMRMGGDVAAAQGDVLEVEIVAGHFFDPVSRVAVAHETYGRRSA